MHKLILILLPISIFTSCKQKSVKHLSNNQDSITSTQVGDTPANVKELISFCRNPDSNFKYLPASISTFIPKGYAALDTVSADINMDGSKDILLAIYKIGEDTIRPSPNRYLKLLSGRSGNSYKLECESSTALPPLDMGGFRDPYPGMLAGYGEFTIQFLEVVIGKALVPAHLFIIKKKKTGF